MPGISDLHTQFLKPWPDLYPALWLSPIQVQVPVKASLLMPPFLASRLRAKG